MSSLWFHVAPFGALCLFARVTTGLHPWLQHVVPPGLSKLTYEFTSVHPW